jgi:hypothetical protein
MNNNGETDNIQLEKFGNKYFGHEFGGVYAEDVKVNFDSNKKYYIFNNEKKNQAGCHWLGLYVDHPNKQIFIFDTFNRESSKILPDVIVKCHKNCFKVKKGAFDILQNDNQEDCGERSLTYLLLVKHFGADFVKQNL